MARVMPLENAFMMVRGLDRQMVTELAMAYDEQFITTGEPVYADRAVFLRNLYPVVLMKFVQTFAEAEAVKAKVRWMVEQRLPGKSLRIQ